MNHRLVWKDARQRCAAERETGRRWAAKELAAALLLNAVLLAGAAAPASSLPTGGQLVVGQAQIVPSGNQLTINQSSQKAILDWQSFDIGRQASVRFQQPHASAVALNRVVAGNASQIQGQLSANGQVWLVNPHGVLFGKGSQVNVGALVASTLDTTNADFMAGKMVFTRGRAAQGGITNLGEISAAGDGAGRGMVALLAPRVQNEGVIRAQLGNVLLAAGDKVSLNASADGLLQLALEPSTVRTLIANRQLIIADGGQVLMTSRAADALSASVVANSGIVQARAIAEKDGRIVLSADTAHGEVNAAGQLQALFVQTSGAAVQINPQLNVQSRHWMIQARDVALNAVAPLQTALTSGAVTVTAVGDQSSGGDIHVNGDIDYAHQQLTLTAGRSIFINAKLSVGGSGRLELNHGRAAKNPDAAFAKDGYQGSHLSVRGQVDFEKQGMGLLRVNGRDYTVINDIAELQTMGGANLAGAYALGADIDASPTASWNGGLGFAPIGNSAAPFTGVFDGLGHRISGLIIHRPQQGEVGLFGHARNALLQNLHLLNGSTLGKEYVGALVGRSRAEGGLASIVNVKASGKVYGSYYVGGLVGHSDAYNGRASILDAHVGGAVQGVHTVGGLVGHNAAYNGDASVCESGSSAQVLGKEYVGGLVAHNDAYQGQARISNVYVEGKVAGKEYVGAVAGYNDALSGTACIANARWDKDTTGQANAVGVDTTLP